MSPRIAFAEPPYPPFAQREFDRLMPPGIAPLGLFKVLAGDERLFRRFVSGGLLDRGHLTLRQREIVIGRVTARCGSEYEWGVHVTLFGRSGELTPAQIDSLVKERPAIRAGLPKMKGFSSKCVTTSGNIATCPTTSGEWRGTNSPNMR